MSDRIFIGTRKGLFTIQRTAESNWKLTNKAFLGIQVPMMTRAHNGHLFAALKHGHFGPKMHRSTDNGLTWPESTTPAYPPKPDDVPDIIDPMRQKPVPWSLDLIWSLECGSDGRLWCGTLPGGLFTSDDDGESWQLNMPLWMLPNRSNWFGGGYDLPGIHSICIDPTNPNNVTIGISCGGIWKTTDRGQSWNSACNGMRAGYMPPERAYDPDIQDPHRMVQCPNHPNHFWVQHHTGMFRSTDYGNSWTEMENVQPSVFGFAVAVHPHRPETAWFVPAVKDEDRYPVDGRFVVTRTQDGGKSFEQLSNGLPGSDAYHLVYRHALDVDATGERLVMGSTTGGLWISECGGDEWNCVTQDLPPIYCVRFA